MARGRGLVKERNGDGTYTYKKRTANGLVVISEEEYRTTTNRLVNKRQAEDGAEDSKRLKRTKSILPDPAKGGEVEVTAITLKDGKVTEDKKLKASPATDGTLHLVDDDGASKKRPADDGAEDSQRLKKSKSLPDVVLPDVELTKFTYGFLVDGDGAKDLSPEKLKERLKLLGDYTRAVTARSLTLYQENDTLKKENLEIKKKYNKVLEKENELLKELTETTIAHNELDDMLDKYQQAAEVNNNINVKNVKNFKEAMAMVETLCEENTQLKAHLNRLNPQEL